MNRADKIELLNQLLQGETTGLRSIKADSEKIRGVVIVDRMPDEESKESVMARYTLNNGTKFKEPLTYAQMQAKAGKVLCIIPDNGRKLSI